MATKTKLYVVNEPGPGRRFYLVIYFADGTVSSVINFETQRNCLKSAKEVAKAHQPASIWIQGKDSQFRETLSFPSVRNADERKAKR